MRKRLVALVLGGLMTASLLAGCGGSASTDKSTETAKAGSSEEAVASASSSDVSENVETGTDDKTITVSVQSGVGVQEQWEAVAKAYEKLHPDVTIDVDLKAADGYDQWVQTAFTTEDPKADIVNINLAGNTKTGKSINYSDYIDNDSPYSDGTWGEQFDVSKQRKTGATGAFDALSLESVQVLWLYNKDIFEKVGVEPPTTWDELVNVCQKLKDAGYQPIAMPGNYDSFYSGTMGWLSQIYADQTTRSMVNENRAQEGDWDFDPDIDGSWTYDPTDPWNDDSDKVTQNPSRAFANIKNGVYRGDTDGMKAVWTNFAKVFPAYVGGDAFFGTDADGAKTLFYQGKAAMMVNGAWGVIDFMNDMKALDSGKDIEDSSGNAISNVQKFSLGTFNMPTMEGDKFEAPVRTIEVALGFLGCISKTQEHNDLVVDFLEYYSSKEGQSIAINARLDAGGSVNGPSLVYGVEYPEEIQAAFDQMTFIGNCQKDFSNTLARGIGESAETFREFYQYSYDYLNGKISIDEWAKDHENNIMEHVDAAMEDNGIGENDLQSPQNEPTGN
jgi:ABC-type glycerol-3-phosphate transport system substrate-binding protein